MKAKQNHQKDLNQNFSNHVRRHPIYHYFAVPISLLLIVGAFVNVIRNFSLETIILLIAMIVLHVAIFLSRDYAKRNQDRIIRTELRLRLFQLNLGKLEQYESSLSIAQLVALRFMSDQEFIAFITDPANRNMQPDSIKKSIKQWNPDTMRV